MLNENEIQVECMDAMADVLKTIQEAVDFAEDGDYLTTEIGKIQEASADAQAVFVIRLLLNFLDEDRRKEALKGFVG